jgi:hypothetical protein
VGLSFHCTQRFFAQTLIYSQALSSNGPHIEDLKKEGMHFILGAKPGDHTALFARMATAAEAGTAPVLTLQDSVSGTIHHFRWLRQVPLNDSHPHLLVNFLEYWEIKDGKKVQHFSWCP